MDTEVMDTEVQKSPFKFTRKKIIIISLIAFILLMLAVTAQISFMVLKYNKIYKGVYVNDIYAGEMSKSQLLTMLEKEYGKKAEDTAIELKSGDTSQKISFQDLGVSYDTAKAVDKAYAIGHTGNIFDRFYDVIKARRKKVHINIPFHYDSAKMESQLADFDKRTAISVKESELSITDTKVILRSGHHGEGIDKAETHRDLEEAIRLCKGGTLDVTVVSSVPKSLDADDVYNKIIQPVKDASVAIVDNKTVFTNEATGRDIDKSKLSAIIEELKSTEDTEQTLPVIITQPKVTLQQIYAKLFKDELFTYRTLFYTRNTNEINRSANIRLDAAKINGTILAPGQVFSYNDTVGKKEYDDGYKDAFTYVSGKMVAGMGGGICQVSSTIYNAALQADLEIVDRRNHMFLVTYVPLGQDATVYYGSTDFKFKNTTNWPLQINCTVNSSSQVVVTLLGTNENPGKKVVITSKALGNPIPFPIKYVDDPTLPQGSKEQIIQIGHNGGTYETYKSVYQDGKLVSSKKITTSYYKPLEQVIKRPVPKITTQTPAVSPTPSPKPSQAPAKDDTPGDNNDVVQ